MGVSLPYILISQPGGRSADRRMMSPPIFLSTLYRYWAVLWVMKLHKKPKVAFGVIRESNLVMSVEQIKKILRWLSTQVCSLG